MGDPGSLAAVRVRSLDEVALTGQLEGVLQRDPAALALLKELGKLNPLAEELHASLSEHEFRELTYGSVVGGSAWDLLFVELTGQCNEACSHCYAESSPERQEKLTLDEVLSVVSEGHELGFNGLQLTGGDPLVSNTYLQAARLASNLGYPRLEVFTNGLALSDRVADELAECGVDFAFSFYSHRPEVHDAITGTPGSQKRTLAAIQRALTRKISVRVGVISMESNRDDVAQTVELLQQIGVEPARIGLEQERSAGRGEFADAGADVPYDALKQGGSPTDAEGQDAPPNVPSLHGGMKLGGKLCVSYSADVYPCIFARHRPLGNIRSSSLHDILAQKLDFKPLNPRQLPTLDGRAETLACMDCQTRERLLQRFVPIESNL